MDQSLQENEIRAGIYAQVSTEVTAVGEGLASQEAKSPVTNVNKKNQKRPGITRQTNTHNLAAALLPALSSMAIDGRETSDRPPSIGSQTEDELLEDSNPEETTLKPTAPLKASRQRSNYRSSKRFVSVMDKKDPTTLSSRDRALLKKHKKLVKNFERRLSLTATEPAVSSQQTNNERPDKDGVLASTSGSIPKKMHQDQAANNSNPSPGTKTKMVTSSKGQQALATSNLKGNEQAQVGNPSGTKPTTSKRARSEEENKTTGSKKPKTSRFDTTPTDLQVAIISRDNPDGKISAKNWLLVENEILKVMMAASENDSSEDYTFDGAGWRKGVKVVCCGDQKSLQFLTHTITNIGELWEGASLGVLPVTAIPLRQQIKIWIPPPATHEDTSIVKLLAKQNKELPIPEWEFLQSKKSLNGEGKDLLFTIDKKSDLLLKEKLDVLRYGLGTVKVRRHDGKGESKAAGGANQLASR